MIWLGIINLKDINLVQILKANVSNCSISGPFKKRKVKKLIQHNIQFFTSIYA